MTIQVWLCGRSTNFQAPNSADPAAIFPTTLFATACSTLTAVVVAKLLCRFYRHRQHAAASADPGAEPTATPAASELADAETGAYPV